MGTAELEAAAALYTGATLEPVGLFAVVDRLVELWLRGGLPVTATSEGSRALDRYWLHRHERLSREERRELYDRVFDDRFHELWVALLAALARSDADASDRADDVRALLGARIGEEALAVTPLLHDQLREALDVLDDREILGAYGARDTWALIGALARLELGTVPDVPRARTTAAAGTAVIGWLAEADDRVTEEVADAARSWLAAIAPAAEPPADN